MPISVYLAQNEDCLGHMSKAYQKCVLCRVGNSEPVWNTVPILSINRQLLLEFFRLSKVHTYRRPLSAGQGICQRQVPKAYQTSVPTRTDDLEPRVNTFPILSINNQTRSSMNKKKEHLSRAPGAEWHLPTHSSFQGRAAISIMSTCGWAGLGWQGITWD